MKVNKHNDFKYNKETLKYEKPHISWRTIIWRVAKLLLLFIGLSILYYLITASLFRTAKEGEIIRETKIIEKEYKGLGEKAKVLENAANGLEIRDKNIYRDIFNSDPPTYLTSYTDSIPNYDIDDNILDKHIIYQTSFSVKKLSTAVLESKLLVSSIMNVIDSSKVSLKNIPSILPIRNFNLHNVGASLGKKIHPFYKTLINHNGVDLIASIGTEVVATANGRVISISHSKKADGNKIRILHKNGYITTYSHLSDILVRNNQRVKQGQKIARVGNSGMSFAPHLHYSVELNKKYQEPINYFFSDLDSHQYLDMLMTSINTGQSLD
ncbi:MAG: M23 family metallopeptidase [Bacteroidales bacterium]